MAIKIPSKHIYNMDNPKIRDNFIDNVEVNITTVTPNNEFDTPVFNETISNFKYSSLFPIYENLEEKNRSHTYAGELEEIVKFISWVRVDNILNTYDITVEIPRLLKNSYIEKIFYGVDDDNNAELKFNVIGTKNSGIINTNFVYKYGAFNEQLTLGDLSYTQEQTEKSQYQMPEKYSYTYEGEYPDLSMVQSVTATVDLPIDESIRNPQISISEEKYILTFSVSCGYRASNFGTEFKILTGENTYYVQGNYVEYIPSQIEITVYGNKIGISLEDGTVTYGSGTKPFSLDGNELLQDSATTNGKLTTQHLAENILAQYKNGKETATLLCDIGEYYEENGTKVIGIEMQDRMSFHEHDLVIPYVFGADGKDRPMSKYSNGEPKVFEVVAVKRFFDGAVWQELSLLEFTKTT